MASVSRVGDSELNDLQRHYEEMVTLFQGDSARETCSTDQFNRLSIHEKRCFVYCSLFPKDYIFEIPQLIDLWMAEGFLDFQDSYSEMSRDQQIDQGKKTVEAFLNGKIFYATQILAEFGTVRTCEWSPEMDDLRTCQWNPKMHDLATFIAGDELIFLDGHGDADEIPQEVRRASIGYNLYFLSGIPKSLLYNAKNLQTLLFPATFKSLLPYKVKMIASTCEAIFSHFKSLLVLDLHDLGLLTVPKLIGVLDKLRYLDLSGNNMEKLPSSITKISKLQTLKLSRCHMLQELPKDLGNLIELRHLEIEECLKLTRMPSTIEKLTCLQTLSHFVVSSRRSRSLEQLNSLTKLTGHLEISHLEQLKLKAPGASFLESNKELESLTLRWCHYNDDENNVAHPSQRDKNSVQLRSLQPPNRLRFLSILGYQGKLSQYWFSHLENLVKFSLYNCPSCQCIPRLPRLKILKLQKLGSLKYIIDHEPSSSDEGLFESLQELTLSHCPNLISWWSNGENRVAKFRKLSILEILHCPNLSHMPIYPDLDKRLVLVASNWKPLKATTLETTLRYRYPNAERLPLSRLQSLLLTNVRDESPEYWMRDLSSLERLHIRECPGLKSLPQDLKYLESLTIENCEKLELFSNAWRGLRCLRHLAIKGIPMLKIFPSKLEDLIFLEDLELDNCRELTYLPSSMSNLTCLRKLVLSRCHKLASLPDEIRLLQSLQKLVIMDCRLLLPRCQRYTGYDWRKISHIKKLVISDASQNFDNS